VVLFSSITPWVCCSYSYVNIQCSGSFSLEACSLHANWLVEERFMPHHRTRRHYSFCLFGASTPSTTRTAHTLPHTHFAHTPHPFTHTHTHRTHTPHHAAITAALPAPYPLPQHLPVYTAGCPTPCVHGRGPRLIADVLLLFAAPGRYIRPTATPTIATTTYHLACHLPKNLVGLGRPAPSLPTCRFYWVVIPSWIHTGSVGLP